jgi:peptidoglycan hydrolase CwlO-like protein
MIFINEDSMEQGEIERTIQFIVAQQAQFVTNIHQLREIQEQQQAQIGRLTDAFVTMTGFMGKIAEAQAELARRQAEMAKSQVELARSHAELEDRFNAFIVFMEKYLSGRGDGHK